MLISRYLIAILVTIVSKYIYKPCESVNNLYSLSQGRQSFLQSTGNETDTPQSVTSGETVEVASNKTGKSATPADTKDEEQGERKEDDKDATPGESQEEKGEDKGAAAVESEGAKGEETSDKTESTTETAEEKKNNSGSEEGEAKSHHGAGPSEHEEHQPEEPDVHEADQGHGGGQGHDDDDEDHEDHHVANLLASAVGGSQGHAAPHQGHQPEEKHQQESHQPAPPQAPGHPEHTEAHHNPTEHAQSHSSTPVVHPHVTQPHGEPTQTHTNPSETHDHEHTHGHSHGHANEETHGTEQHAQVQETEDTKDESTQENDQCEGKGHHGSCNNEKGSCPNPQTFPKASGTAEVAVEPHKEAEGEAAPKHHEGGHAGHTKGESEEGEQPSEPPEYKVDLKNLTDDQKKAVESFFSKPDGQCAVDCEHSCKSALGGKTQCVSSTDTSVSCSTFANPSDLTCPKNYTPCVQPVVTTLKSFTMKSGNEEVGQVEVDGSNFSKCMGLALAPKNGSCEKDKLVYNLLYTSRVLNLDYTIEVGPDKLTYSNLKIKNGEFKVCVFHRYVGDTTEGTLASLWEKLMEFFNPTKQTHQQNKAVFSLEVGSLKVTD